MSFLPALVARGIRIAAALSPALAGDLANRAFFVPGPRMPVAETDRHTHDAARRSSLQVRGSEVTAYEWGAGEHTVLLLHGWGGRASQFAPLVRELLAEGLRVVSFDAPAHGSSGGRRTDIRDWLDAAEQLQAREGRFHAIIGHSFGALAALTAARSTVPVPAVAAIAGAASPDAFVSQFSDGVGLDARGRSHMERRFHERLRLDAAGMSRRYDAARHPLPAGTELLVAHDRRDRRMPDADSLRLHAAHGDRSRMLRTDGEGHTRILRCDVVLDAVVELVTAERRAAIPSH